MTEQASMAPLRDLARIQHGQAAHRVKDILAEEARLRANVTRLHLMAQRPITPTQQTIGVDLLWRRWIGKKTAEENMRLARVLAQKEHQLSELRMTFGKLTVLEELTAEQARTSRNRARTRERERVISLQFTKTAATAQ